MVNDSIRVAQTMLQILKTPDPESVWFEERANGVLGLVWGRTDRPVCFCGNTTFTSCYPDGTRAETYLDNGEPNLRWGGMFSCDSCDLIVDGNTRQVIRDGR